MIHKSKYQVPRCDAADSCAPRLLIPCFSTLEPKDETEPRGFRFTVFLEAWFCDVVLSSTVGDSVGIDALLTEYMTAQTIQNIPK